MNSTTIACMLLPLSGAFFSCSKGQGPGSPPSATDSFTVVAEDGYGGGRYRVGDTVHIFSVNYGSDRLFDHWTGDPSLLEAPREWHTWFVMPARNVSVSGNLKTIAGFSLDEVEMMGRDRMKPVFYYFPSGTKGVVYLLHGTGGSASHLVADYEWQQLITSLVDSHFGIIVTEAEEATAGVDANGDGKIRWRMLPYDSVTNVDFANIRIITDSFCQKGLLSSALPRYAIGMSDGGFFAGALSALYHYRAEVNYCAQGSPAAIQITNTPLQFCMARFDTNPQIGQQGNAEALANAKALNARGVCSRLLMKQRCPLYPERFARGGSLTDAQSQAVFQELSRNGYLNNQNYFIGTSSDLVADYQARPGNFPVIGSLTRSQQIVVTAQITLSVSDHKMYSDYDQATVNFLSDPCQ